MKKTRRVFFLFSVFILLVLSVSNAVNPFERPAGSQRSIRDFTAHLIGHAHIDLSWLWLWEETVHEVAPQTFWGTLRQMDRLPGLTFAQSQACLYEAMEKHFPELCREIEKKIKTGTWVPVGGMWVEPDLNMPAGESLARQVLYGKRYFLDKFGVDVRVGWNPDSFGHSWQLPQILKKAGLDYYVFERCAPEQTRVFWWEGLDGSRILAYVPPGWYLVDLKEGVRNLLLEAAKEAPLQDFLLLYGEGDHGGGPRDTDVEAILKFRLDESQPRLELTTPEAYFKKLEQLNLSYPIIRRELNFTFPGCYTTQAETKKLNRRLENLLIEAEKFSSLALLGGYRDYYPERDLDEAWKIVLRHQFHDILDGSSIGPVYEESRAFYEEAEGRAKRALDFSLEAIANSVDTRGPGIPLLIFNSLAWERTEPVLAEVSFSRPIQAIQIVDSEGTEIPSQVVSHKAGPDQWRFEVIFVAKDVPSLGYKTYRVLEAQSSSGARTPLFVTPSTLENEFLKVALDPQKGWMKSLVQKKVNRNFLVEPGSSLLAIRDEPEAMSAWELGLKEGVEKIGERGAEVKILERGPVRTTIQIKNHFRNSTFIEKVQLFAGVPRLDIRMSLDWEERNLMIKAAIPAAVQNSVASFEIPYGVISRPTTGDEVPALSWMDLTDQSGQFGLSVLNDSRYGCDVKDNVLRLSLIRGATSPDPEADRGGHELAYSLYPHAGTWKDALTFRRGLEFNTPLRAKIALIHDGHLPPVHSFLRIGPENVVLASLKKEMGYGGRSLILRLYEIFGREEEAVIDFPVAVEVRETDLIERPLAKIPSGGKILRLKVKPYEIKTLRLTALPRRSEDK
ncbi:MAG: alpha-mannosidase [Candidatus Aminicenantales bacterium]